MCRSENVSGFAVGLRETSGEYSWTCRANPCGSTANRAWPAALLRRDAQGTVLPVRVDDDARHLVPEQLLDQDPEKVALASAGLR